MGRRSIAGTGTSISAMIAVSSSREVDCGESYKEYNEVDREEKCDCSSYLPPNHMEHQHAAPPANMAISLFPSRKAPLCPESGTDVRSLADHPESSTRAEALWARPSPMHLSQTSRFSSISVHI